MNPFLIAAFNVSCKDRTKNNIVASGNTSDSQLLLSLKSDTDKRLLPRNKWNFQFPKINQDLKKYECQSNHSLKFFMFFVTFFLK